MTPSSSHTASTASQTDTDSSFFDFQGKILRKKNISAEYLKLAIIEDGKEKSTAVYIPRKEPAICTPSEFNFLHLDAIVHVRGRVRVGARSSDDATTYYHATRCSLVTCAPNIKLIKEVLALPPDRTASFASTMNMDEEELRNLIDDHEESGYSQKLVINTIVERITGKRAKAPPRYRPGRIKRSDMDILERKEAEGTDDSNDSSWKLCRPCQQSPNDGKISSDRVPDRGRKEAVVNLPAGAGDSLSAHGKLTRFEYLETKKNVQATWFVERMRRSLSSDDEGGGGERPRMRRRILDVGGGRGDLAVRIALEFPHAELVVVDCNESSVLAGREYAAKSRVKDRIEFLCVDFVQYVKDYDDGIVGEDRRVDFVVALHACGDLSDLALSFASSQGCEFIICPCCYPKRYLAPFVPHWHGLCKDVSEVNSLSRLVELDDHREVSRRAMLVINSMRQSAFEGRVVTLEELDDKISKRNIALVGECAQ